MNYGLEIISFFTRLTFYQMKESVSKRKIENIIRHLKKKGILFWSEDLFKAIPGSEVYLVGGSLRDLLLGKKDGIDYDFVVSGVEIPRLKKFLEEKGGVDFVGQRFGVFKFKPRGAEETLDVALPRTEHPLNFTGKRQDFKVSFDPRLPIEKDLLRRDFTINAMAMSIKTKRFIDPCNGQKDLKKKIIRAVSNPAERFREDYSRMLRSLRFSLQLQFEIEPQTFKVLKSLMRHLNDTVSGQRIVPYEIIASEILKSFMANPEDALDLYDKSGALKVLIPELLEMKGCEQSRLWHTEGDVWEHTKRSLKKLDSKAFKRFFPEPVDAMLIVATLFHDLGKVYTRKVTKTGEIHFYGHEKIGAQKAREICQRVRLTSARSFKIDCEELYWLVKSHLLIICADPDRMRASTIEKYFFSSRYPGRHLLKLILADALATIPRDGKANLSGFKRLLIRIELITDKKGKLPQPLLTGNEIMNILKIPPGPKIREIKDALREMQLSSHIKTKREAEEYIRGKV